MDEQDEITSWNFFTGFQVEDIHHGCLGEIVAVDDSTMNVLFVIEKTVTNFCFLPTRNLLSIWIERTEF